MVCAPSSSLCSRVAMRALGLQLLGEHLRVLLRYRRVAQGLESTLERRDACLEARTWFAAAWVVLLPVLAGWDSLNAARREVGSALARVCNTDLAALHLQVRSPAGCGLPLCPQGQRRIAAASHIRELVGETSLGSLRLGWPCSGPAQVLLLSGADITSQNHVHPLRSGSSLLESTRLAVQEPFRRRRGDESGVNVTLSLYVHGLYSCRPFRSHGCYFWTLTGSLHLLMIQLQWRRSSLGSPQRVWTEIPRPGGIDIGCLRFDCLRLL